VPLVAKEKPPLSALSLAAKASFRAGHHEQALALAGRALARDPNDLTNRQIRARSLGTLGRVDECLAELDLILSVDPAATTVRLDRGRIRVTQSDFAGALKDFDDALARKPGDIEAHAERAGIITLSAPPGSPRAYAYSLEARRLGPKSDRKLVRDADRVRDQIEHPGDGDVKEFHHPLLAAREAALLRLPEEREDALEAYRAALAESATESRDADDPVIKKWTETLLGRLAKKLGLADNAREHFERVLRYDAGDPEARTMLGLSR
jgi:tetratricopeptide (TPR) repeat protein